jgi:hypothetical protein
MPFYINPGIRYKILLFSSSPFLLEKSTESKTIRSKIRCKLLKNDEVFLFYTFHYLSFISWLTYSSVNLISEWLGQIMRFHLRLWPAAL